MEAVIVKDSPASVVWKWIVENNQFLACLVLVGHFAWQWFYAPTVLNVVFYCAVCTYLAATAKRRWLLWAWIFLMLLKGALGAALITQAEQKIVSKPIVVFCGNCEQ